MDYFLLVLGIVLTAWAFLEGLWTALWVDGNSAPITSRLTTWTWRAMRLVIPQEKHRVLSLAGPLILALTVFMWIVMLWLGWTLIFYGAEHSIVNTRSNILPEFSGYLWYTAYTMFTVGNGDFSPGGELWQVLSSIVALGGMMMVTLSVTYVLQVLSAVVNKRSFSSQVYSIGKTPEALVSAQWTGKSFGAIELQLNTLSSQLSKLNEQHLAYPVLHYYHAARAEKANALAVTILDEALSIIKYGVPEEKQPPATVLMAARESIRSYLDTLKAAFIQPADEVPPSPDWEQLRENDVPVKEEQEFLQELQQIEDRRKLLLGLVQNDAWYWPGKKK